MNSVQSETRAACCMLCVTMMTVYRSFSSATSSSILERGGWVERRGRLVHEQHFRFDGERPRDAETLLLTAREPAARIVEPVLHLVPQARCRQCALSPFEDLRARETPVELQASHGVVGDAHGGEWVRSLEHHPDTTTNLDRVDLIPVDVGPVEQHLPFDASSADLVVHPIETSDQRRLPAAGRPDHRGHLPGLSNQVHAVQDLVGPEPRGQSGDFQFPHAILFFWRLERTLAEIDRNSTATSSTNAPPHAIWCSASTGVRA